MLLKGCKLSTIDLLIKMGCFVTKKKKVNYEKQLISTSFYKEANRTDPSPQWEFPAVTCFSEFLLGDSILIAPVLEENATSRDIYLPAGQWEDQVLEGSVYDGPLWLKNYPAPLDTLPYFIKV